jgi:DNA-directed RNA polymerase subunit E'/Rpb7
MENSKENIKDIYMEHTNNMDNIDLDVDLKNENKDIPTMKGGENKENPQKKGLGLYMLQIINRKISLPFHLVGSNIKELLQKKAINQLEGKCSIEGYVKPNSVRLINYSSGIIKSDYISFDVVIECLICCPIEGMRFKITINSITKAGIRGGAGENSPVDVFIARDHHYDNKYFNSLKENDKVSIRVIGQRYEINDSKVAVIAELINPNVKKTLKKPKIVLKE